MCFSTISNRLCSVIVATGCIEIRNAEHDDDVKENTASDSNNHAEAAAQEKQGDDTGGEAVASNEDASQDAEIHDSDKNAIVESGATLPGPPLSKEDINVKAVDGEPSQNGLCLDNTDMPEEERAFLHSHNTGIDCNVEAPELAEE